MRLRALALTLALVTGAPSAAAAANPGPSLNVDVAAARHPISPYIYGWNFAPAGLAAQIGLPVDRRGGNAADTLNWQTGVENHSNDWFFENLPQCFGDAGCDNSWDPARSYTDQIDGDRTVGAKTVIDLPELGPPANAGSQIYVAGGAATFAHPVPCSFTAAAFPTQDAFDTPYDTNCGNGYKAGTNKTQFVTNTPQTATAALEPPSFDGQWIDDLVNRYGDAAHGGVQFYELGNEPGLWSSTHHDWHPQATTASELWNDMLGLAQQVKQHDPTAQVIGPAEWGWPNYFCSASDGGCGPAGPNPVPPASDYHAVQGDKPLIPWLLSQFKAYEDANGTRLLDYVDVHYYRQDGGAAGFDATRSLWDPTYVDQSWIGDTIDLIPRMQSWAADNYPGTKTSLSEYDLAVDGYNQNDHVTQDVLTEADVLGIFGREGLDLATLWPETGENHYADAFRMFRSYDGNHSQFGDTSISASSGDQGRLAIYGAQRSGDGALTLLVVNKNAGDLTSPVALSNFTPSASAQVYQWTDAASGINRIGDQAVGPGGFTATFPSGSMTMFVIPPAVAPPAAVQQSAGGSSSTPSGVPGPAGLPPSNPASGGHCRVPKLAGLTLRAAKTRLRAAHCALGKVTKKRSPKHAGRVIAQTKKPGARLKTGAKVGLVLSRGR